MTDLAARRPRAAQTGAWLIISFLFLPITIVLPISLTDRPFLSMPAHGLSGQWYRNFFGSPEWLSSVAQSAVIATGATVLAVGAGSLCAVACWRLGNRVSTLVRLLMLIPTIVPTIVYALGFYRLLVDLNLLDTYTGVILAHAVTGMPYVVIIVSTALAGFDIRLEHAARSLGAGIWRTLWMVQLPNIKAAVASGAIFAFVHSWDELVLVLFIAGRAVFTLPRRMWDGINDKLDPTMAAVATMLVALTILLLVLFRLVQRGAR